MSNPKRNHHVVPQLYLKGFVIKKGEPFIWVYKRGESYNPGNDRIKNNPYKASIGSAGVERDFYAEIKKDGTRDFEEFENRLEALEKPANQIFRKLRAHQDINDEERSAFSSYIIMMWGRVWAGRKKVTEMLPQCIAESSPSKEFFKATNIPDTAELRVKWKQASEKLVRKDGFEVQLHNRIAARSDSFLIEVLQKMNWSFQWLVALFL